MNFLFFWFSPTFPFPPPNLTFAQATSTSPDHFQVNACPKSYHQPLDNYTNNKHAATRKLDISAEDVFCRVFWFGARWLHKVRDVSPRGLTWGILIMSHGAFKIRHPGFHTVRPDKGRLGYHFAVNDNVYIFYHRRAKAPQATQTLWYRFFVAKILVTAVIQNINMCWFFLVLYWRFRIFSSKSRTQMKTFSSKDFRAAMKFFVSIRLQGSVGTNRKSQKRK